MDKTWVEKTNNNPNKPLFTLAPNWYIEAKNAGAGKEELYAMVRDFCTETLMNEAKLHGKTDCKEANDNLVELMIQTYEA